MAEAVAEALLVLGRQPVVAVEAELVLMVLEILQLQVLLIPVAVAVEAVVLLLTTMELMEDQE
jgi:hypothetical protein